MVIVTPSACRSGPGQDIARRAADIQDDWDASEDEKPKAAAKAAPPPPVRQKKLKDKLAEKERLAVCPLNDLIPVFANCGCYGMKWRAKSSLRWALP